MSQPLFVSSAASPMTAHGENAQQSKIFQQQSPEKSIQQELEEDRINKRSHYTEKVTPIKFVLFIIFIVSFQIVINLRTNFTKQLHVNTAIGQYFLNQVSDFIDYPIVDSEKLRFNDINTIEEVSQWVRETIIDGLYSDHNGELYTGAIAENALLYPSITALRVLQKRAKLKSSSDNANFEYIWDLSTDDDDMKTFSSFKYSSKQKGFNLTIPVPFYTRDEALTMYNDAITGGFYDEQTKHVGLDFTVMNIYESLATHFQADFDISPSGRIKKTRVEIVSYSARFYTDTRGKASIFFQLVFAIMFLYYFVQEFINIANHIKNIIFLNQEKANSKKNTAASPDNRSPSATTKGRMLAEGFQQAKELADKAHQNVSKASNFVRSFIKGFISYLTDPWSLFNVLILACCLGNIIIWCILLKGNNLYHLLSFYNNDPTNTATKVTIYDSNDEMDKVTRHVILFQQFAAVNSLIMIAKLLKFIGATSRRLRAILSLLGNVTVKLVPFFILFLVFIISFMYMIHFMYGDTISDFSTIFSVFRYLLTGLDYNYDQADAMINVNKGVTILFHIVYVFLILFILVSLIYVFLIHAFEDYINERKNEKKKNTKIKGAYYFNPHPIWRLKECLTVTIPMMYFQICKKKKYKLEKSRIKNELVQDEKELANYQNFDFDIDIRNKNEEQKDLNPLFNNEVKIKKILKEKKLKTVESFWGIIILWISFVLLTIVATEHQRIYDGASAIHSLKYLFELNAFSINNKYQQVDVAIENLRTPGDVMTWIQNLFAYYPEQKDYTRKDGSTYFLLESNLILTNQYRMTLRKRKIVSATPSPYNMFYNQLITDPFKADDKDPSGEEKSSITVTRTDGTQYTYKYTEDDGYSNRGGYVITSMVPDFGTDFEDIVSDKIIDNTYNSLVIDFPLYSTETKDIMYVALVFEIDAGNKIDTTIDISYLGLNYYSTAGQRFIALIEILTVIWFFVFSSKLILRFKSYEDFYDFWYSLYIAHFPAVIKKQRQKKEPEWVRRVVYMYGFSNIVNICLLICYFVAAGLWITYLCQASIIQRQVKEFINLDSDANSSDLVNNLQVNSNLLFASKLFESLFLFFIIIKILYFYSNFSHFNFLTITIKKSAKWIGLLLIIMLVFIIGFGFFIQNIRGPMQSEYNSFFNIIIEHMQALNALPPTGMALLTGNYDVFITIIYYIPWLIFVTYIVLGVFTAIVYNGYKTAIKKQSKHSYDQVPIGIKEFFELTWELCRRKKKTNKKMKFDFNEQMQEKFNNRKVFEEFDDNVNLAYTAKDMKLWATNCTKAVTQENEVRKSMKRTAKEIFKASTVDFDTKGNKHKKIMTDDEKLSHFELRAAYWNYFRFGSRKLLKHMSGFNQGIKALEGKVGDPEKKKENQVVDAKIKKYILHLEAQVSQNLQDVQNMRRTLDEFEKEKHNLMLDK